MPNRREFLQMSVAASALPGLAMPSLQDGLPKLRATRVVVEATSPLALAFREETVRLGLQAHIIHDDITDLWCRELAHHWRNGPEIVAGMTLSTSLFCLETLAHDYGMRLWRKNTVDPAAGEHSAMVSWIIGPRNGFLMSNL